MQIEVTLLPRSVLYPSYAYKPTCRSCLLSVFDSSKLFIRSALCLNEFLIATIFSLRPCCAYFRLRKFKPRVAKVSAVCVEKTLALVAQHSERKCESSLSSSHNSLVVI